MTAEVRIRAERKAGTLLAEMPKNKGGQPARQENLLHDVTGSPPTLTELGIERIESHRWQKVAEVPEDVVDAS